MNQKETILLTAFKMFAENGYDGVSLNSIIKETGLTKGGVYYHFNSKDELFKEVVETFILKYFTKKVSDIVRNTQRSIDERLRDLYLVPAMLLKEAQPLSPNASNAFIFNLMFDAARKSENMKEKLMKCYEDTNDLIRALLTEGIESNKIKESTDVDSLSIEIVSIIDGIQIYTAMVRNICIESVLNNFFTKTWDCIKK